MPKVKPLGRSMVAVPIHCANRALDDVDSPAHPGGLPTKSNGLYGDGLIVLD